MGYEDIWKVLESFILKLKGNGVNIPTRVLDDLHSAKTMIQILKADSTSIELKVDIERYMQNIESHLTLIAHNKLGQETVERWLNDVKKARYKIEDSVNVDRFIPGLPRNKHWIRIRHSEVIPEKELEDLAEELGLTCKIQHDGYLVVSGEKEKIKKLVKKLTERVRRSQNIE